MNNRYYILLALIVIALLGVERMEGSEFHLGFFAWFGFASCMGLILVALLIGKWVKRKDDYYDV